VGGVFCCVIERVRYRVCSVSYCENMSNDLLYRKSYIVCVGLYTEGLSVVGRSILLFFTVCVLDMMGCLPKA
jgi:hypothetical protein